MAKTWDYHHLVQPAITELTHNVYQWRRHGATRPIPIVTLNADMAQGIETLLMRKRTLGDPRYQLERMCYRLSKTHLVSNIPYRDDPRTQGELLNEPIVSHYRVERDKDSGQVQQLTLTLSQWIYGRIEHGNEDYLKYPPGGAFLVDSKLEQGVIEMARHFAVDKPWSVPFKDVRLQMERPEKAKHFEIFMREVIQANDVPGFTLSSEREEDKLLLVITPIPKKPKRKSRKKAASAPSKN